MDPALITGATAVATGFLGYSGALLQHRAERERLRIEEARVALERTRLQDELEAGRGARLATEIDSRRDLYFQYLESAESPWWFCQRLNLVSESELDEWWLAYQRVRRHLKIGGSEAVVEQMLIVNGFISDLFVDLVNAVRKGGKSKEKGFNERIEVWKKHRDDVNTSLRQLEATMRTDLVGD